MSSSDRYFALLFYNPFDKFSGSLTDHSLGKTGISVLNVSITFDTKFFLHVSLDVYELRLYCMVKNLVVLNQINDYFNLSMFMR